MPFPYSRAGIFYESPANGIAFLNSAGKQWSPPRQKGAPMTTNLSDYTAHHEALAAQLPPLPEGARDADYWTETTADGVYERAVYWPDHSTENASALLTVAQYSDERPVQPFVSASFSALDAECLKQLDGSREGFIEISTEVARELAAVLLAAVEGVTR